jgi:hypothetical protein
MRRTLPGLVPILFSILSAGITPQTSLAQQQGQSAFNGHWVINEKLSDDTDYQVEVAIKKAGGRIQGGGNQGKGRYRGGPAEHALYDHLSYDEVLDFHYAEPEFRLAYDGGFERVFYSDNRRRVISASGTSTHDNQDFSFASWDGDRLLVESRLRDGGWIFETFLLETTETGQLLKVILELKPSSFAEPINITRIYNRATPEPAQKDDNHKLEIIN